MRIFLTVGSLFVAALTVGLGGLAAWTVSSQNNSAFATGTVHHSNAATVQGGSAVSCTDASGTCGAIFTITNAKPGNTTTGTVQITNTGTLQSTFTLMLISAVTTGTGTTLCANLTAAIVDNEATPLTVYSGPISSMPTEAIKSSAGSVNFNTGNTGTYTWTVTLPTTSPNSDQDSTCTVGYRWSQTNT